VEAELALGCGKRIHDVAIKTRFLGADVPEEFTRINSQGIAPGESGIPVRTG
jgi:hypothetical protein